ncbi:MAG: ATP-binding protein [Bdellovibrionales bacterium]|nr:ATP-binding protein [Bdellovibrionales bacterium]
MISNITNNAVKFTKPDSTVTIALKEEDDCFILKIKDEGPGIPESHVGRVFNEFETVGNVNTHHKGTGLGMPISKRLIEAMGGSIGFECPKDGGTEFFIKVPKEKTLDEEHYKPRPDLDLEVA